MRKIHKLRSLRKPTSSSTQKVSTLMTYHTIQEKSTKIHGDTNNIEVKDWRILWIKSLYFWMKNRQSGLISKSRILDSTLNRSKIKNQPSRPLKILWLTFPETRQIVLMFRLKKLRKTRWDHLFILLPIRPKFCTAEIL